MIDLQKIVELGQRATKRPYSMFHGKLRPQFPTKIVEIQSQSGAVVAWPGFDSRSGTYRHRKKDADYLAVAANSADIMAKQLLDIAKLCDYLEEHQCQLTVTIEAIKEILER